MKNTIYGILDIDSPNIFLSANTKKCVVWSKTLCGGGSSIDIYNFVLVESTP